MDIDGDGVTDILSGSYSRKEGEMAGLFFVLRGSQKGFETPQVLKGMDENPLVVTAPGDARDGDLIRICTRPTAVDIDGDGHLDVVSGNMEGTFFVFQGQGKGRFESKSTQLMQGEKALKVSGHSDPFFIDWDRDGDLDLLSGSGVGGVTLFTNLGSSTEPKFGPGVTLLEPQKKIQSVGPVFGHAHVKGPQGSTRVWADDLNGDGKWDLIVGDAVDLHYPADGLTEEEAAEKLGVWETQFAKLNAEIDWESASDEDHQRFEDFYKTREKIVRTDSTGYVWLIYQK